MDTREALSAATYITPDRILAYLNSQGWRLADDRRGYTLWTLPTTQGDYEVAVPGDHTFRDYARRLLDLLETLAAAQAREPAAVLDDLLLWEFDVIRVRLGTNTPSGTAPLAAAARAHAGAYELVLAAAVSAVSEELDLVHPGHKPPAARRLMDRSRIGPSGEGSYLLSIQMPISAIRVAHPSATYIENLSGRTVSRTLHRAVHAVHDEVTRPDNDLSRALAGRIEDGVSANLCAALAEFGGDSAARHGFEVGFSWAGSEPAEESADALPFTATEALRLREAAAALRRRGLRKNVMIRGLIINMDRAPADGPGIVTIDGWLESTQGRSHQRFRVELSEADYRRAGSAHTNGQYITVRGDLFRSGIRLHMRDVQLFQVEER